MERHQLVSPVDAELARTSLRKFLESWKKGEKPEALKDGSTSIVALDLDWSGGMVLTGYEIQGQGKLDDAKLRVPVKLMFVQPNGKTLTRSASFFVGASPADFFGKPAAEKPRPEASSKSN